MDLAAALSFSHYAAHALHVTGEHSDSESESIEKTELVGYGKASEETQGPGFGSSGDSNGWPRPF